jgi:tRNA G18 (ribose-2'-O)-methylase SpoU
MPQVIPIDNVLDERLTAFRDVRERDLVGRQGRFIAEGEVVLRVLISRAPGRVASVLIAEKRLAGLSGLLSRLPEAVPVYVAGQAVMDGVVGFPIHRGVLALGVREPPRSADERLAPLGDGALVLVLMGLSNHDNIGGVFRNAAAFGADAVILDGGCCDPLYRKAIRVSVGASLITPYAFLAAGEDPIEMLARRGFTPIALSPAGATPLNRAARPKRTALLLGAEGPGLAPAVLARCETVGIPMAEGFDSLNVAAASAVALHHFRFIAASR